MSVIASEVTGSNQDSASAQPDSVGSFSFEGLHEKAMNFGQEAQNTPAPQEQVEARPAAEVPAANEATDVTQASAAQLAQLKDDDLVEVPVGGQMVQLAWKDAKAGIMRQQDYTRGKQQIARERQELEANKASVSEATQQRDALVQLLNNEQYLQQFLQAKYPNLLAQAQQAAGQPGAKKGIDPDDIPTVGDVQQQIGQFVEGLRNELKTEIAKATTTIEDRQAAGKLALEVNSTIEELFNAHPYIKKVNPHAEDLLRWNVLEMAPSTPAETLQAFKDVFAGWVEGYKEAVAETTKSSVIEKQKLVSNNIQPSGGVPPQPVPEQFYDPKSNKVDWAAMNARARALLESK